MSVGREKKKGKSLGQVMRVKLETEYVMMLVVSGDAPQVGRE